MIRFMNKNLLFKYIWLVDTIGRAGRICSATVLSEDFQANVKNAVR